MPRCSSTAAPAFKPSDARAVSSPKSAPILRRAKLSRRRLANRVPAASAASRLSKPAQVNWRAVAFLIRVCSPPAAETTIDPICSIPNSWPGASIASDDPLATLTRCRNVYVMPDFLPALVCHQNDSERRENDRRERCPSRASQGRPRRRITGASGDYLARKSLLRQASSDSFSGRERLVGSQLQPVSHRRRRFVATSPSMRNTVEEPHVC